MSKVRLQHFLAQAGVASRRRAEELVLEGRVTVNGKVVRELGVRIDPRRDEIGFDGNRVDLEDKVWLLLNKPAGAITTVSDPEGRQTVLDLIGNQGVRLYPVGRLDFNTEGVLLLTNDGELANALMHPSRQVPRVYEVKLRGIADPDDLEKLRQGVLLDGERVSAEMVHVLHTTEKNTWIEMTLRQGMNRQVHRMVEAIGGTIMRLIRLSYAGITVKGLRPGEYRALTQAEVDELRTAANLKRETVRAEAVTPGRRTRGTLDRPRRAAAPRGERPERRAVGAQRASRPRAGEQAARPERREGWPRGERDEQRRARPERDAQRKPRDRQARDAQRKPRVHREPDEQRKPRDHRERDEQRKPRVHRERDGQRKPRDHRERDEQRKPRVHRERDEQRKPRVHRERDEQRKPRVHRERDEQRKPRDHRERDEQRKPRDHRERDEQRKPRDHRERDEQRKPLNRGEGRGRRDRGAGQRAPRRDSRAPSSRRKTEGQESGKKPWWPTKTKKKPPPQPSGDEE